MTVHIIKLCVGVDSVDDLEQRIILRQQLSALNGEAGEQIHTTRMTPKRREEILDGGSLYWVIKGMILARQKIVDLRAIRGEDGIGRCQIVMDPTLVRTESQPRRAFQGWRYLKVSDAPRDIDPLRTANDLPEAFRRELADLGLL
ncbi:DUF1489 family protein [Cohaesibacter celericrescens]|uniref:DUF1489 domain-containing protein n=1 Tax=Cohaesibacter celericrescens TaxID=2067669 RepID=A0A2N5XT73_9HYPH|nr:DUF1489 domain-containing protein [Cohaesibacter celericrescens]PLW77694.1 DUF1489 domain-containing protein [Cohaesibacter celericrescens]